MLVCCPDMLFFKIYGRQILAQFIALALNSIKVKAIAHETKMKFYLVTAASILDKWMGNSEKNVKELFENARKNQPSIVFIGNQRLIRAQMQRGNVS